MKKNLGHDSVINESIVFKIGELTSGFLDLSQEISNAFNLLHGDVKQTLLNVVYAFMQSLIMYFQIAPEVLQLMIYF